MKNLILSMALILPVTFAFPIICFSMCSDSFDKGIERLMKEADEDKASQILFEAEAVIAWVSQMKKGSKRSPRDHATGWLHSKLDYIPDEFKAQAEEVYLAYMALSGKKSRRELIKAQRVIELKMKLDQKMVEASRKKQAQVDAHVAENFEAYAGVLLKAYELLTVQKNDESIESINERFNATAIEIEIHFGDSIFRIMNSREEAEALLMNSQFQKLLTALLIPRDDSVLSFGHQFVFRGLIISGLDAIKNVFFKRKMPSGIVRIFETLVNQGLLFSGYQEALRNELLEDVPYFIEKETKAWTIQFCMEMSVPNLLDPN